MHPLRGSGTALPFNLTLASISGISLSSRNEVSLKGRQRKVFYPTLTSLALAGLDPLTSLALAGLDALSLLSFIYMLVPWFLSALCFKRWVLESSSCA